MIDALHTLTSTRGDVPAPLEWLADREAEVLSGLTRPARRASWLLGRWTAKQAVAAILATRGQGSALDEIEILAAPSGAPEVFLAGDRAPFSISLSHREDEAIALIGPANTAIGVDLEQVEPRSPELVADFFTAAEQRAWERAPAADRDALACLVWSAKESALKVLGEGLRRDTRSVSVEIEEQRDEAGWGRLRVLLAEGGVLAGFHRRDGARIITVAASATIAPPTSINARRPSPASSRAPSG